MTSIAVLAVSASILVVLGPPARAGFINFDATGSPSAGAISIGGIDLAPGNALAVGSIPDAVGATFQLDYQSAVSGLINTNGMTIAPPGLNATYQITAVASLTEVVQSVVGPTVTFALASTQSSDSFFQMYYNPSATANGLAGTGYNQGTLILSGRPAVESPSIGIFTTTTNASGQAATQAFDQFGTSKYSGLQAVQGSGSIVLSTDVTYQDSSFFQTPLGQLSFHSSLVPSFAETDPAAQFLGRAGTGAPDVTPAIGSVNGLNGSDFQLQADANLSFAATSTITPSSVPEPASVVSMATGLLGALGLLIRAKGRIVAR